VKFAPLAVGVSLLGLVICTTGCSSTSANLRLMNAMTAASSIDMLLDSKSTATGITYGAASAYTKVDRGSRNLIVESTGSSSPLLNQTINIPSGDSTVVATNSAAVSFADDNSAPSSGNIKVRVINASPSLGTVDVYVVTSGTSISGLSPTFSSLAYQTASGYQMLAAGSYQVIFTQNGQQYSVYTSSPQSFSASQIRSVVVLDAQNGGFTAAILSDLN
jgi:trimeric autotransporter adhesin